MEVGLLLIQAVVGTFVAAHGITKLTGWVFGGRDAAAGYIESVGLTHGRLNATVGGTAELVGGVALAAGFLTPVAAALIASAMIVALRTDHRGKGFWIFAGGGEYALTTLAVAIGLAFNGAGPWSVDAAIGWDVNGVAWGLGALGAAVISAGGVLATFRERLARVTAGAATAH